VGARFGQPIKSEVDTLGVITISRGCFERCCSNKKTPPYPLPFSKGLTPEVFERSSSKSSPLEQTRSKLANPVEATGSDRG